MPSVSKANHAARRYVGWLQRRAAAILVASALVQGLATYLCLYQLPLHADFASLLPQNAPSVRDLHRLEQRVRSQDTILALVVAPDPAQRAALAAELSQQFRDLPADLVARVEVDDADTRAF